jgi:excisionase family DNA binding protein
MASARLNPVNLLPRGLSADEAARYVGVGRTKFEELVKRRSMPGPKRIDGRLVYDRYALDAAFTDLPEERVNKIDEVLMGSARKG